MDRNNLGKAERYGIYGEIMPEGTNLSPLWTFCDVFDLIWLEKDFSAKNEKDKIGNRPRHNR